MPPTKLRVGAAELRRLINDAKHAAQVPGLSPEEHNRLQDEVRDLEQRYAELRTTLAAEKKAKDAKKKEVLVGEPKIKKPGRRGIQDWKYAQKKREKKLKEALEKELAEMEEKGTTTTSSVGNDGVQGVAEQDSEEDLGQEEETTQVEASKQELAPAEEPNNGTEKEVPVKQPKVKKSKRRGTLDYRHLKRKRDRKLREATERDLAGKDDEEVGQIADDVQAMVEEDHERGDIEEEMPRQSATQEERAITNELESSELSSPQASQPPVMDQEPDQVPQAAVEASPRPQPPPRQLTRAQHLMRQPIPTSSQIITNVLNPNMLIIKAELAAHEYDAYAAAWRARNSEGLTNDRFNNEVAKLLVSEKARDAHARLAEGFEVAERLKLIEDLV